MEFSTDLEQFPSEIHREIYQLGRRIISIEKSCAKIKDPVLLQSCKAYHAFVLELLSDMYESPTAYHFPVGELEAFLNGRTVNGMKQREPAKTKRLISYMRNTATRYLTLLAKLGYLGTPMTDGLLLKDEDISILEKVAKVPVSPISLNDRLKALSRVGLVIEGNKVTSIKHPDMFSALCALAQPTGGKTSGFAYYNFENVDFRNLSGRYKPDDQDYYNTLIEGRRQTAYDLHNILTKLGCRPSISTFLKVDYKYHGMQVACVENRDMDLVIRITETYNWDDSALIENRIKTLPESEQKYMDRHLWRCTGCSTSHLGVFIQFLGHRYRVCGGGLIGFIWTNPGIQDLLPMENLLKMRCEIINELNKIPKTVKQTQETDK